MNKRLKRQSGLSLIEAVVAIVIIAVCVAGIMRLMSDMVLTSSKTLQKRQALLIASSYLEEIMAKPVADPQSGVVCSASPPAGGRPTFIKVCDYSNLFEQGVHDQNGNAVPGLGNYEVAVNIIYGTVTQPSSSGTQVGGVDAFFSEPNLLTQEGGVLEQYGYLGLPGPASNSGNWQYLRVGVNVTFVTAGDTVVTSGSENPDTINVSLVGARYIYSPPPFYSPNYNF